ncbi:hypothetical protein ASE00_10080 [Sphingomonas sp. Root710]|uniref:TonB-dependent receptor n=1 Tax=Sphingomonas sp. Root710 TaxID=1736594 RepID=UPI000701E066|nr:TonB-dependent receptor [Sphingomonas sp. Root710]KRB82406.1 hypothetical protein ASE00_10080 [Sphingomonas sp. Root710]
MKNRHALLAFLAFSTSPIATAHAQVAADSPSTPAATQDDGYHVEDIVVTARKREERLQDVPVAISALSGSSLLQRGSTDIRAVATLSPGVFYRAADRRVPSLYIRGIGTRSFTDEADASIGTFVDGVYIARFSSALQDLFDVERVEVLKGPQGTLFGRNTIGGALNIVTRSPTDEFHAQVNASHTWNQEFGGTGVTVSGLVSGPIAERVKAQVSASYSDADGVMKIVNTGRTGNGGRNATVRGKLIFDLSDDAKLTLNSDYYDSHDETSVYRSNDVDGRRPTILLVRPGATSPVDPNPYKVTQTPGVKGVQRDGGGVSLTGDFSTDAVDITTITAYRKAKLFGPVDFDGTSLDLWLVTTESKQDQFSQEIRFSSKTDGPLTFGNFLKWTFGAYYFTENVHQDYTYNYGVDSSLVALPPPSGTGGTPITWVSTENIDVRSYALFGQVTLNFTDALSLDLGGRYTKDKKDYVAQAVTSAPGIYRSNFTQPASRSWSAFDPTAILSYKINRSVLAYASYSRGFKSGAYQLAPATPLLATQAAKPERMTAYQAGLKSDLLGGRMRLNIAGFYYKYSNIQVQRTVLLPGQTTTISLLSNGAKSTLKGFEVDGQFVFTRGLRAEYGYSYLDAKYDSYIFSPTVNFTGNHLPRSPKHTLNAALVADIPLSFGSLNLRGGGQYVDSFYWEPSNFDAGVKEPSYTSIDLSADLKFSNFRVGAFVTNLTGNRQRTQVVNINPTRLLEVWGPRRTIGVRAGAEW